MMEDSIFFFRQCKRYAVNRSHFNISMSVLKILGIQAERKMAEESAALPCAYLCLHSS